MFCLDFHKLFFAIHPIHPYNYPLILIWFWRKYFALQQGNWTVWGLQIQSLVSERCIMSSFSSIYYSRQFSFKAQFTHLYYMDQSLYWLYRASEKTDWNGFKPLLLSPSNTQYVLVAVITVIIITVPFYANCQFCICHPGLTGGCQTHTSRCLLNTCIYISIWHVNWIPGSLQNTLSFSVPHLHSYLLYFFKCSCKYFKIILESFFSHPTSNLSENHTGSSSKYVFRLLPTDITPVFLYWFEPMYFLTWANWICFSGWCSFFGLCLF